MRWFVTAALWLGIAIFFPFWYKYWARFGWFVPRIDHSPGPCRVVPGVECGSEDFAVTKDGLAFISNGIRIMHLCRLSDITGNIYLFNFSNPEANVSRLSIVSSTINFNTFEPHGLGLFENVTSGAIRLFVVDHSETTDVVRIFEYTKDRPGELVHVDDVRDERLQCLNDVTPTGPRSFYATRFLRICLLSKFTLTFEFFINLFYGITGVVYFDGNTGSEVISGLKLANGLHLSRDGEFLHVLTVDPALNVFKRNISSNEIATHGNVKIPLNTFGDNVIVDEQGDLYIGGVCNSWYVLMPDYDGPNAVPAQVVRIRPGSTDWSRYEVSEVLYNSGINFVRFSSAAAHYKGQLLIGTVNHKLGHCYMKTVD